MLGKLTVAQTWTAERPDSTQWMDEVVRYAYFRLGNREDAEDIAAQVLLASRSCPNVDDPKLYLIGIARRKVADHLRRRSRLRFVPLGKFRDSIKPGFGDTIHLREDVGAVLRDLSDEHREALVLKYVLEMSASEIATLTGRTPTAVNSLLQRAREAFAQAAGDQFEEDCP